MFCLFALPRSKQFSNCVQDPSNWVLGPRAALTVPGGPCVLSTSSVLATWFPRVCCESTVPGVLCVSSWELMSGCDTLGRCQLFKDPRKAWLATGSLLTVWRKMQSLGPRLHQPFQLWLSHACHSASREGGPYMAAGLLSFGAHSALSFVSMPGITV